MHADVERLNDLSGRVIGCAFTVLNTPGAGFVAKVYEPALAHELRKPGVVVAQQRGVTVIHGNTIVGEYLVDFLVEELLIGPIRLAQGLRHPVSAGSTTMWGCLR